MTFKELEMELVTARKEKEHYKKEVLSSVINAIRNAAIAKKCKDNISEELVNEVLLKEKKILQEQIDTCPIDRVDNLSEYMFKMEYLKLYCPQLLSDPVEIQNKVKELCAAAGLECTSANRPSAMKLLMPQFKGKADMKIVNQVISEIFSRKDEDK